MDSLCLNPDRILAQEVVTLRQLKFFWSTYLAEPSPGPKQCRTKAWIPPAKSLVPALTRPTFL